MKALSGFCRTFQPGDRFSGVQDAWQASQHSERSVSAAGTASWQAASTSGGPIGLALCGEIYNVHELRDLLGLPAGTTLPEVMAAAWRRWSLGLLPRLNGVFALALRDGDELLLYRDPSGLQNLFFSTAHSGQISFATDLGTMRKLPGIGRRLSRRSVHEYLRFLDVAAPHTLFEDVAAVEAGQALRWTVRGISVQAIPPSTADDASPTSFAEAVDRLDEHLQRSVQARLAGAARPAAFLSGGVDSSLLCALAAHQRPDMTALTVGFDGAPYDEAPIAQRVAARLGIAHEVLRFSREQHLAAFETLGLRMEQPSADPAIPATVLAFDQCRDRFDAVLDGTGADEVVGGIPPRHVRLAVEYGSLLPASARRALAGVLKAMPALAGYAPLVDFEHPADTMIRWRGFTRPEIEALCGAPVSFADTQFYRTFARYPRGAHFERYSALVDVMPCERLNQATLATGMAPRYPYWDMPTARYIRQLRTDYRTLPGEPKRILRTLLARYVPRNLWEAPKHGFDFPLWDFLSADDYQLVRRHLGPGCRLEAAGIRAEPVQAYVRQFTAGDRSLTFRVWALVVLGAWLEGHGD
jgi:asparagine synthase (glutamine-hydrolysing)